MHASPKPYTDWLVGSLIFLLALALYLTTLAPGLVFGDPAEYTFVPHVWGISHPPGYAFQTVLGGIWQRIVPIGSIAYRANLLSAVVGAGIATLVYGTVRALSPPRRADLAIFLPGILAGASTAVATDIWQHSIHANAHIVTALLATTSLFLLAHWRRSALIQGRHDDRYLYTFCVVAGLGITHHPLLAFSLPAYLVFILVSRPRILFKWLTLLKMMGFALLGLSVWLYLPIRSSLPPPLIFGPEKLPNTLDGFLDLVLARGLRVNLFHFGLADQIDRLTVFWSLLRLQTSLPLIVPMGLGFTWLWWKQDRRMGLLFTLFLGINLIFIINTIQDVMAYLMLPFVGLVILAGLGLHPLIEWARRCPSRRITQGLQLILAVAALALPLWRAVTLAPRVSLRNYRAAEEWVEEVYARFEGQGEGAILLAHWEHLTPLWYTQWVKGRLLDESDLRLVFVATTSARPWVDNVWANIDQGPIYVSGYQRELIDEGFRLRPVGPYLYRVLPPPATRVPQMQIPLDAQAGPVAVLGVDLPQTRFLPGENIPLNIALYAHEPPINIIFPYTTLGDPGSGEGSFVTFNYTTDSHWLTPWWQPDEVIVERYDLRAPFDLDPGIYSLHLGLRDLTQGGELRFSDGATTLEVGTITILPSTGRPPFEPDELMADIAHQLGLVKATVSGNGQRRVAVWSDPLLLHPGDAIRVQITWAALSPPDENWKVFVHLIDGANRVVTQQDAPPLDGAFPTFLWFPKWVPGQMVIDPFRLVVPLDTPPGDYQIEIGLYGFSTLKRAPFFDPSGNLSGDRFILGTVRVEP